MHELIVPDTFARFSLEAHKTVTEEIVAEPVAPIHVTCRRRQRYINVAELFIGTQIGPGVCRARVFPGAVLPCLDAELALLRNSLESPAELTGLNIVSADVAGRTFLNVWIVGN